MLMDSMTPQDRVTVARLLIEANDPNTGGERLVQIARLGDTPGSHLGVPGDILFGVAENPSSTTEILEALVAHITGPARPVGYWDARNICARAALHPNANVRVVITAARQSGGDENAILGAIAHPEITADDLDVFSGQHSILIKKAIIRHSLTTPETLGKMVNDYRSSIVRLVAADARLDAEKIGALTTSEDVGVRKAAVGNPSCPEDRVLKALDDFDDAVAKAAARAVKKRKITAPEANENELSEDDEVYSFFFSGHDDAAVRLDIARNPNTDGSILANMVDDDDIQIAQMAARNPNLDFAAITPRIEAGEREIRRIATALAENRAIDPDLLLTVVTKNDYSSVALAAVKNPQTTPVVVASACRYAYSVEEKRAIINSGFAPMEYLTKWARDYRVTVVRLVAAAPNADYTLLSDIATNARDEKAASTAKERLGI